MLNKQRQSGFSLTEILVVVSVMAILMAVSIPATKALMASFESSTGVRHLINAALSNARTIAVREQAYAGVRFQPDKDGNIYMIFIVHDPDASPNGTGLASGFRAVQGRKPMKLPENVGVINSAANTNTLLWGETNWRNANTFSIVFSPQGKLTTHPVQLRNKDGYNDGNVNVSNDTIFNIISIVDAGSAMFYQDDYGPADTLDLGLTLESSTQSFFLYSRSEINMGSDTLWSEYFSHQTAEYISPYTGELIMEYREKKP